MIPSSETHHSKSKNLSVSGGWDVVPMNTGNLEKVTSGFKEEPETTHVLSIESFISRHDLKQRRINKHW